VTELTTGLLIALALGAAAWAGYYAVRERAIDNPLFYGLATLEVLLLAQLVAGLVALGASDRDVETATFVGYLLTTVLILPVAVVWAVAEKSRWGTAVLVVAGVTIAALVLRSYQVWTAPVA
jgi:hypothetical protein